MAPLRRAGDLLGTDPARHRLGNRAPIPHAGPLRHPRFQRLAAAAICLDRPKPFAVASTGTWVIAMAVGGAAVELDPARDTLVNVNAFGEPVPSARFMGGREFATLVGEGCVDTGCRRRSRHVLETPILLTPSVQQGSGPFPRRKAEWIGGEPTGDARHVAASFYLAMMTATALELIGADGPTIVEGPFAANRLFVDMLAAATARPVIAAGTSATGTSIGAALLAAGEGATSRTVGSDGARDRAADGRRMGSLRGALAGGCRTNAASRRRSIVDSSTGH